jgi:hypothetical protein
VCLGGDETGSTWYVGPYRPIILAPECGALVGTRIGVEYRSTLRKPAPVPLSPPQIPQELT